MLRYGRTVHAHDHDAGCAERTASRRHVVLRRFALAIAAALALPATANAADIHATPATFASAVSSAQAGDRVLLATGSYGTWSGTNKAITVMNDAGATPTMKFAFGSGDSGFTLDGMSGMSGDIDSGANHITIKNSAFNDTTTIQGVTNGAILFDHDTFNNINATNGGPPARIWLPGSTPHPSGVTVQNSQLIGGSTDGIQAGTALTILNNEFANIVHGSCSSCHTDNIQLFGGQADDGVGSVIKGNYLHDGETGIVQFDGGGGHDIEDNVIARMSIFGMDFGGDDNSKIIHNTQFQSTGNGLDMTSKAGQNSVGEITPASPWPPDRPGPAARATAATSASAPAAHSPRRRTPPRPTRRSPRRRPTRRPRRAPASSSTPARPARRSSASSTRAPTRRARARRATAA
jgi:hypothetical protein